MTFKKLKTMLKAELKALAKEIRLKKNERGPINSGYVHGLERAQGQFRIKHIAYCILRGTPYEKIEPTHTNEYLAEYSKEKADKLLDEYKELLDEITCVSA